MEGACSLRAAAIDGFVGVTLFLYQIPLPSPVRGIWRFIRDVLGIGYSP
jgi:hypothetical protein